MSLGQKCFGAKEVFNSKNFSPNEIGVKRIGLEKLFGRKNWIKRKFNQKDFWVPRSYL